MPPKPDPPQLDWADLLPFAIIYGIGFVSGIAFVYDAVPVMLGVATGTAAAAICFAWHRIRS